MMPLSYLRRGSAVGNYGSAGRLLSLTEQETALYIFITAIIKLSQCNCKYYFLSKNIGYFCVFGHRFSQR